MRKVEQGTPTDNPEPLSICKQMRSTESPVEKEQSELKFDLSIEGIAQDVILKDEERMGQIQKVVDKFNELDTVPNQLLKIWRRQTNPSSSAKSRVAQFTNSAILDCTSWDRDPEPSSANLA